jgi:hypothetical protein
MRGFDLYETALSRLHNIYIAAKYVTIGLLFYGGR